MNISSVALGNHPIQIPSGERTVEIAKLKIDLLVTRVPWYSEAVHQGCHQDPAQRSPPLVCGILQVSR